ncbi:MAG: DUF983 domain-containing protein [Opitutaceae bacterium]|nr:DUF983 domain-containing protein [Opitutaceae bacterium]
MKVTHGQIISRGLTNCCPNCGGKTLFKEGTWFELDKSCRRCGLKIEKDEGFFLGAMAINYGVTLVAYLLPVVLLWYGGVLSGTVAIVAALAGSMIVPILLYRSSRSWQLMLYYSFLPQHLPANRRELGALEDENV